MDVDTPGDPLGGRPSRPGPMALLAGTGLVIVVVVLGTTVTLARTTQQITISLAAALAVLGSFVLALSTVAIVARREIGQGWSAVRRLARRLGAPARRRRRLRRRRALWDGFAASPDLGRRVQAELLGLDRRPGAGGVAAHAVSVTETELTVWGVADDLPSGPPWTRLDEVRRRASRHRRIESAPLPVSPAAAPDARATCLVRVGVSADGAVVLVDLSRLDGVLSVDGHPGTAQDVIDDLVLEVARNRPDIPVVALEGVQPIGDLGRAPGPGREPGTTLVAGSARHLTTRGTAWRHPVQGLVVGSSTASSPAALQQLSVSSGSRSGWAGVLLGTSAPGAHWHWHAHSDGTVSVPVLGLRLLVPARPTRAPRGAPTTSRAT